MIKKKIGSVEDLKSNNQFSRWINDHDILVYKYKNSIHAISNICPHFGGPIGYHEIKYRDGKPVFTCLWHNLQFNVDTGQCITQKKFCLRKYKVSVEENDIYVYIN
tara:strand:- start:1565 stop:1882 length:318 start_codon:yes stop_codon:yes gene_type:complete